MRDFKNKTILAAAALVLTIAPATVAQTRISFAKGRTSATVSGTIAHMGNRCFAVAAKEGQWINATLRSRTGQAQFLYVVGGGPKGGTTYSTTAITGDNQVCIENFGPTTTFALTVSIPASGNSPTVGRATLSDDWNSFWTSFRTAVRNRDRSALRDMMSNPFEYSGANPSDVNPDSVLRDLDSQRGEGWAALQRTVARIPTSYKLPNSRQPARVVKNPLPCSRQPCDYTEWIIFQLGTDGRWRWISLIYPGD